MATIQERLFFDCGNQFCELCHPGAQLAEDLYGHDDEDDEYYGGDEYSDGRWSIKTIPWQEDGRLTHEDFNRIHVDAKHKSYKEVWPALADTKHFDIVGKSADFWLLQGIKGNVLGHDTDRWLEMIINDGRLALTELVAELDKVFLEYCPMAVGGELRHHKAISQNSHLGQGQRERAWTFWKYIADHVGPSIYLDAVALFLDFKGGGFGGPPWARGAEVVHARLTGKISPEIFVDRVLDLEHNGGCFLNKVEWQEDCWRLIFGVEVLKFVIGPAHHAEKTQWDTLLFYATEPIRKLFIEYRDAANYVNRRRGLALAPPVRARHPQPDVRSMLYRLQSKRRSGKHLSDDELYQLRYYAPH